MIDKENFEKLRAHLWEYAGDAARNNRPDREAAFMRAIMLVELAAGNIKGE